MTRKPTGILLAALLAVVCAVPLAAQTEFEGETAGGAFYKIVVPDNWNGGLVIWNHGFSLSPPGPVSDIGLLADLQLLQGYAVAASSYRQAGWALFKSNKDLKALVAAFKADVGESPDEIILTGASLGGAVTAFALEKANLPNVTGALMYCGAIAGSRNWDGALDLRLLYDLVCGDIPQAAIAGGPKGLEKNSGMTANDVSEAVNACTGVSLPRSQRTREQRNNLQTILEVTQLPESFLQTVMGFATLGLSDLSHDRGKLRSKQALGNENVDYGDAAINEDIERVKPKKGPARRLAKNFTPKGKVKDAKIVSMHTDKDGLVIVENESVYASVVPPDQLTTAIVVEQVPTHCVFSPAEAVAAWESLREWIGTGNQPTAQTVQDNCEAFTALFPGPCRVDPDYEIADMDGRIRPRD